MRISDWRSYVCSSDLQRQRVAIARAIVSRPRLIVADEPVSALDLTIQKQVIELLQALQRERGFACLFVTHDLAVVEQVADRVVVLEKGRIVEEGATAAVFANPRHDSTRRLLAASPALAIAGGPASRFRSEERRGGRACVGEGRSRGSSTN